MNYELNMQNEPNSPFIKPAEVEPEGSLPAARPPLEGRLDHIIDNLQYTLYNPVLHRRPLAAIPTGPGNTAVGMTPGGAGGGGRIEPQNPELRDVECRDFQVHSGIAAISRVG